MEIRRKRSIRPRRKKRNSPEADIQMECVRWFKDTHPDWKIICTPNEACARRIDHWVAMGLAIGTPDLMVVKPGAVIFVEMKSSTGRCSLQQKEMHATLEHLGHEVHTCRSLSHFKVIVEKGGNRE